MPLTHFPASSLSSGSSEVGEPTPPFLLQSLRDSLCSFACSLRPSCASGSQSHPCTPAGLSALPHCPLHGCLPPSLPGQLRVLCPLGVAPPPLCAQFSAIEPVICRAELPSHLPSLCAQHLTSAWCCQELSRNSQLDPQLANKSFS